MKNYIFCLFALVILFLPFAVLGDDVPAALNYQGELTDNLGGPLTSGYYHIEFRIWEHPTESGDANLIWGRMFPLHVMDGGIFNILLSDDGGEVSDPTPQTNDLREAFGDEDRYLGLTITRTPAGDVSSPVEISPRQRLVSAPYAFHSQHATFAINANHADNADHAANATNSAELGGLPASDYVLMGQLPAAQTPATLLVWDGANASSIDGHIDGTSFVVTGYTVRAAGLIVTNGVITPSVGGDITHGIEFPANPATGTSDRAWMKYSVITNEDCLLEIGVDNDLEDDLALHASGEIRANANEITLTATDTLSLHGKVQAFGSLTQVANLEQDDWYTDTTDRDTFYIVFLTAAKVTVYLDSFSFPLRAARSDDWNEGTHMFPVAKGETIAIHYEENLENDSHVYVYKRPVGL
ncbi:MAG: hypothetical protein EOM20_07490 [Spartobacteria bacterium]|nr:hypothetical protein [Spartobacteria bacterium]